MKWRYKKERDWALKELRKVGKELKKMKEAKARKVSLGVIKREIDKVRPTMVFLSKAIHTMYRVVHSTVVCTISKRYFSTFSVGLVLNKRQDWIYFFVRGLLLKLRLL